MTIAEALQTYSSYPVPTSTIDRILIERGLDASQSYDVTISVSKEYRLAKADVFMQLYTAPDLKEGDIWITPIERESYRVRAESIYAEYGVEDNSSTLLTAGYIGEQFNT